MEYRRNNYETISNDNDLDFIALHRQLSAISQSLNKIAQTRENSGEDKFNRKLVFKFTKKEIKDMPESIRKIFIANNYIVSYRITSNGYYEARVRRKDMYIEASGRDFETMRRRFINRLNDYYTRSVYETISYAKPNPKSRTPLFTAYAEEWLKIKEQTTKPSTYKEYARTYNTDLKPAFSGKSLAAIKRTDVQNYLFAIVKEGKHRKAEKIALMLNCIFDMAQEDFNIPSPMKKVVLPHYQTKKGNALTKDEELRLINYCKSNKGVDGTDALLVLNFFGLRKSELKTIEVIDGKWLQCETSKERLGQGSVLRKIPFTPAFRKVSAKVDFEKAKKVNLNTLASRMKKLFPSHHLHELRYTFITRAKECGVNPEVVMRWSGHSEDKDVIASRVNRGYTDFSVEYELREAEKVDYL